jgi:hypothetical protein
MFGAPDKDKIKAAFQFFHQRLSAIEADTTCEKEDKRLSNVEQLIMDLESAFK